MRSEIRVTLDDPAAVSFAAYRLAGRRLLCSPPLAELSPFREPGGGPPTAGGIGSRAAAAGAGPAGRAGDAAGRGAGRARPATGSGRPVFDGEGWVGGVLRRVVCRADPRGYLLEVEGGGRLLVSADGRRIATPLPAGRPAAGLVHSLLGPALGLALALDGVYCLHASAVVLDGRAIAFVGESGAGKSTLAARLGGGDTAAGCRRVADDVLPVAASPDGGVAHPRFPQLKLAAGEQWGGARPEGLPLAAVYRLRLAESGWPLVSAPLGARDGAVVLVRHTVAGLLFDPPLKARHLDFAAGLASRVGVRELVVPRGAGLPAGLVERLRADSAAPPAGVR